MLTPGEVKLADGRSVEFANLDVAATAPCLRVVADAVAELLPFYGSVHRGAGALSERCTREYEQARETVADVLGHGPGDTVVFTRNTTDAFNLLARAVPAGTTVVTFDSEHHANLLPWRNAVRLRAPRSPGEAVAALRACLAGLEGDVLVSVTAAGNVTGEVWPVERLAAVAHGSGARIAVDAAQLAPHAPGRLAGLGADYIAFSGHKLYAPFGAGVLAGRADWLDAAEPYLAGGGAGAHVADDGTTRWVTGPARHEAGTPNLLGAVALATALRFLHERDLATGEQALLRRLREGLAALPHVRELRLFPADAERVGIVSFTVAGRDPGELAVTLGREHGIGVRTGLFCAHPLTRRLLGDDGPAQPEPAGPAPAGPAPAGPASAGPASSSGQAIRASFGIGTTPEHIDRLLAALQ
ncbi:aminotransferase class V-fold PLP-dependent enzyme [Dactylosporangium matsuzakiense]|uniref:aminotransferase class V-fold PLP-dependent enzyme n=1 Tax=Dactylosporangium matsuzakiense TaxID=53360 RepID=UPI0021C3CF2A|nr:aminotransferase class V-fold PLP-dependent enzyme [Dactylosporangium matsuzakiense]UWZ49311.1 aminotransferase class V-fold PLP-dependent enzyme [Dactylosporangium matsuzakiense]